MRRLARMFDWSEIWVAFFGWMMFAGFLELVDGNRRDLGGSLALAFTGSFLCGTFAKIRADETTKAKAEADSLRAQVDWHAAYRSALLAALDDDTREHVEAAADSSQKVLDVEAKTSWATLRSLPCRSTREALRQAAEELRAECSPRWPAAPPRSPG